MPSILVVDTGPLVALFDRDDQHHANALAWIGSIGNDELITTLAVITEVDHLLQCAPACRADFLEWLSRGAVEILGITAAEVERISVLCRKYIDVPMDLADASLVALCERLDTRRIATCDADFQVYRLNRNRTFQNTFTA